MKNQNIDNAEIQQFDSLSSQWWSPNSTFKTLHHINPIRLGYIQQRCTLPDSTTLDLGCGGGILSEALAKMGASVVGIDMSKHAIAMAKDHKKNLNLQLEYHQSSAESWADHHPETYDIICCLEMLEHVPDPSSVIQACYKMLKPHGHLFLSTINRNFTSYLCAIALAEHAFDLIPKGTHDYQKLIKPSELAHTLRLNKFTIKDISGLTYNPFSETAFLSRRPNINYLAHALKVK